MDAIYHRPALVADLEAAHAAGDHDAMADLLGLIFPAPDFVSDGPRVASWLAVNVVQTKGRFARIPLVVEQWQFDFLCELYRLDADGRRVYQEALLLLPRKNGKSTLAAGLGLYHLCADYEDSPEVYVAAGSRDQAKVIFRQAVDTVASSPTLSDYLRPYQFHIAHPDCAGIFRVLASDFRLQHGSNPSANLIDEKWAHKSNDLTTALTSGTGARDEPMTATISTVGHDLDSPLGEDVVQALKGCELESREDGFLLVGRDPEAGFLLWYYGPPFDADAARAGKGFHYDVELDDPDVWRRSNPASWIRLEELTRQRRRLRLSDFRRFRLNAWTESDDLWLPEKAWPSLKVDGDQLVPNVPTWGGVDVGQKKDRAAVTLVQLTGEYVENDEGELRPKYRTATLIIEPPGDGRALDIAEVRAIVREAARLYDLREVGYDPWRFEESAQTLADEGVPMTEIPQSNERMCPASQRAYDAIVGGRLQHDGDPDYSAHVHAGATVDCGERGWRLTKRKATKPIDALIALVLALDLAERDDGGSVYEDRGIVVLGE